MKTLIYIVDDEPALLKSIRRCLHVIDADIILFTSPIETLKKCQEICPNLLNTDQRMPLLLGTQLIAQVKELDSKCQCFLLSAYHDFDEVAKSFNLSHIDRYIAKPWDNKELVFNVTQALGHSKKSNNQTETQNKDSSFNNIIAESEPMQEVFNYVRKAAASNVPIFIHGETGTGKELIAKACHNQSFRAKNEFIAINCANFSESLMESQLFGHKKGSFTGATQDQAGMFAAASNGTIFLDEVTCIPLALQAKLLRVIQEREFSPLGSHQTVSFEAQIISASSTSLNQAVEDGNFREDLYYRLNVIHIPLPPLRDRDEDILLISQFYLNKYNALEKREFNGFDQSALNVIKTYHWPGNVRQLENLIHSLVILGEGKLITGDMISKVLQGTPPVHKKTQLISENITPISPAILPSVQPMNIKPLWQMEQQYIEQAILFCEGNITKAASLLEISPSTIYRKQLSWQKYSAR